jgi:anti-sigma regulatory factor (Ser/Thr protein kinase)
MRELAENVGFCRERVNDIELVVDEIFSNAVEHGSVGPMSHILIHCSLNDEMIRITISDPGRGEYSNEKWVKAWSDAVNQRTKPDTERGHGLLLTYDLADEMAMKPNSTGGVDVHLAIYKGGSD